MPLRFERTFGAYPISIATSLAIEGITHTGEYLDRGINPPVDKMEYLMVNLRTVFRNVVQAYPASEQARLIADEIYEGCVEDYSNIVEYTQKANPHCEVQLYLSSYKSLNRAFKEVNFKKFETPKQVAVGELETKTCATFKSKNKDILKEFDYKLNGPKRCVVMTHHPIDLLSYYDFPDLSLLESHTGVIKERKDWYTKLNLPKGCNTIPFNRPMLCIFGDKVYINSQDKKVKKVLLELSVKYHWNGLTTVSKQIADCKRSNEIHLAQFIKQYNS